MQKGVALLLNADFCHQKPVSASREA